jgi:hypothetical protein
LAKKAREAEARAAKAEEALKALETRATTAEQERDAHAATLAATREEMALGRVGLTDPDAVILARQAHARLPEKGRPELADWWSAQVKDPKARETLSPGLAAYLPAPAEEATKRGDPPPNVSGGAGKKGGGVTMDTLAGMDDKAQADLYGF